MKRSFIALLASLFALASCSAQVSPRQDPMQMKDPYALQGIFNFSTEEFDKTLNSLPADISALIKEKRVPFLVTLNRILSYSKDTFALADKQHSLPSDYAPADLVSLNDYPLAVSRNDLSLRRIIMPDVMAMKTAAENDGLNLVFSSSYRSFAYQDIVYKRNVKELGQEQADRESARPGTSQHQLGTVIDFGSVTDAFGNTPEGKWLFDHAWEYGFTLSYPEGFEQLTGYRHESWHYRWIGRPAAMLVHEYFKDIQHYFLYYINENWDFFTEGKQ